MVLAEFPTEAVRDLLGVVRALYASEKAAGAGAIELRKVARVGGELSRALALAASSPPGSPGHASACKRAEAAALRVQDLVDALTSAEPLVTAARLRVSGVRIVLRTKCPDR